MWRAAAAVGAGLPGEEMPTSGIGLAILVQEGKPYNINLNNTGSAL